MKLILLLLSVSLYAHNPICNNIKKDVRDMIYTYHNELDDASDRRYLTFVEILRYNMQKVQKECPLSNKERALYDRELKEIQ